MLKQLALLIQNKIALAAVGAALVAGGGAAAVAVAHTSTGAQPSAAAHATETDSADAGNHAHTVAIEGTITVVTGTNPVTSITVKPKDGSAAKDIGVNKDTTVNGAHANKLSDLKVGQDVQVQATEQSDKSLLAWKITVQGTPEGGSGGNGSGSQNAQAVHGTVVSVDTAQSSFVLKLDDGSTVTVTVNASTAFDGRAQKLTDLSKGMMVAVHGTKQSNGNILADRVSAAGDSGHP